MNSSVIKISNTPMTINEAKKTGSAKALRAALVLTGVIFVIFLLQETKGDFANGILFFMQGILNGHLLVMLAIFLGLTWLLGGPAGKAIIYRRWNFVLVANVAAVTIMLSIISYMAFVGIIKERNYSTDNIMRLANTYFLQPLIQTGLPLLGGLLVCWLWATYRIWLSAEAQNESNENKTLNSGR
jgi:hypothetical protein